MKKPKIQYLFDKWLKGEPMSLMDALNMRDENGKLIPYTNIKDAAYKMRKKGYNLLSLTPSEVNKRLGYNRYKDGNYKVYMMGEEDEKE